MRKKLFVPLFLTLVKISLLSAQIPVRAGVPDLSGVWKRDLAGSDTSPLKVLIVEFRNELVGIDVDPYPYLSPGAIFLKATRSPSGLSTFDCKGFTDRGLVQWFSGPFKANGPDHFEITGGHLAFTRISRLTPGEVACDPRNSSPISGAEALARGWLYTKLKDDSTAACWFRLGANQGYTEALMWYGSDLLLGRGVAKNVTEAFPVLQKAAMQGSDGGAKQLEYMFGNGVGVLHSDQRSRYWKARAELIDPAFVHRNDFLPIPKWASDTSGPCQASNPSHVNEDTAFRAARVAYQARALETAACWFQISQRLGSVKANVYLGILNMYGLGVPKNPTAGFEYMQKAANANDAFAVMYLANFYRFGMGTKPDHNHGSALVSKALRLPDGLDAFTHVEGTVLSPEESANQLLRGLSAASSEDTCNSLNAIDRSQNRDCTQTQGWFLGTMKRPARNTLQHPEEIMPENFDFVVPGNIAALKLAAKMGLTR
jgi:TPR repeat protein